MDADAVCLKESLWYGCQNCITIRLFPYNVNIFNSIKFDLVQQHKLKQSLKCLLVNLDVLRIKEKFDEEFMNLLLLSKHLDCY